MNDLSIVSCCPDNIVCDCSWQQMKVHEHIFAVWLASCVRFNINVEERRVIFRLYSTYINILFAELKIQDLYFVLINNIFCDSNCIIDYQIYRLSLLRRLCWSRPAQLGNYFSSACFEGIAFFFCAELCTVNPVLCSCLFYFPKW